MASVTHKCSIGHLKDNEHVYFNWYDHHIADVVAYLHERPDELLVMRLTDGENLKLLLSILCQVNLDPPDIAHRNQGDGENNSIHQWK